MSNSVTPRLFEIHAVSPTSKVQNIYLEPIQNIFYRLVKDSNNTWEIH